MNSVFIDTSAMFAFLVSSDQAHERAVSAIRRFRSSRGKLVTTSYNLVEAYSLIDRRAGREAAAAFRADFAPLLEVAWVDGALHDRGLDLQMARPSDVSLVDAVSFVFIQENRIDEVLAFDRHFEQEGFPMAR